MGCCVDRRQMRQNAIAAGKESSRRAALARHERGSTDQSQKMILLKVLSPVGDQTRPLRIHAYRDSDWPKNAQRANLVRRVAGSGIFGVSTRIAQSTQRIAPDR